MIVNPSLPSGFVTFCDDIRLEVTGKRTMVGVYNGQLLLAGDLPAAIPQICALIDLRLEPTLEPFTVIIKVLKSDMDEPLFLFEAEFDPSQSPPIEIQMAAEDPDALRFVNLGVTAQMQNVIITGPCALKVRAYIGLDEFRLGALQILVTPTDAFDEQPAK